MKKLSTAFLIVLTVALFVLSTSTNIVASANTDLGNLDTWVDLNDATATFTPDPSLTWDSGLGAYTRNLNTPVDGIVNFNIDYTWDDDHARVPPYPPVFKGKHTYLLDVYVGGTSTPVDDDYIEIDSYGDTNGGGTLTATATGVSVNDVFDCYLVATADDIPGTGYDSVSVIVIITMV